MGAEGTVVRYPHVLAVSGAAGAGAAAGAPGAPPGMMAHASSQAAGPAAGLPELTNGDGLCRFPTAAVAMHRGRGGLESKFASSQFRRRQVQDREVRSAGVSPAAEARLPHVPT